MDEGLEEEGEISGVERVEEEEGETTFLVTAPSVLHPSLSLRTRIGWPSR